MFELNKYLSRTTAYRTTRYCVRNAKHQISNLTAAASTFMDWHGVKNSFVGVNGRDLVIDSSDWSCWDGSELLHPISEVDCSTVVAHADAVTNKEFLILGQRLLFDDGEIRWNSGGKGGQDWEVNKRYQLQKVCQTLLPDSDIKIPWELSRCQHLPLLSVAFLLTNEDRYFTEVKEHIRSWIKGNPVGRGVNWLCPMDVGIRVVNWLIAIQLVSDRISQDEDFEFYTEFLNAVWRAGSFIERNLEWGGPEGDVPGNHFVANLAGLIAAGGVFANTQVGRRWLEFAAKWTETELGRQVNADGTLFETSTSYHRLSMEMFVWSLSTLKNLGFSISDESEQRLSAMADFVHAYIMPSGSTPQFGDNDSGRLVNTGLVPAGDHSYLVHGSESIGSRIERDLLGISQLSSKLVKPRQNKLLEINAFSDGGFYFAKAGNAKLGFRAGPVTHFGAHAHCDQLSIVLSIGKDDFLVDRGTGCYHQDIRLRNKLRSTKAHTVPCWNSMEQCEIRHDRRYLFSLPDDTHASVSNAVIHEGAAKLVASHSGYTRYRDNLCVTRTIEMREQELVFEDTFDGLRASDVIQWSLHFCPRLKVVQNGSAVVLQGSETEARVDIPKSCHVEIVDYPHSKEYGEIELAKAAEIRYGGSISEGSRTWLFKVSWIT